MFIGEVETVVRDTVGDETVVGRVGGDEGVGDKEIGFAHLLERIVVKEARRVAAQYDLCVAITYHETVGFHWRMVDGDERELQTCDLEGFERLDVVPTREGEIGVLVEDGVENVRCSVQRKRVPDYAVEVSETGVVVVMGMRDYRGVDIVDTLAEELET